MSYEGWKRTTMAELQRRIAAGELRWETELVHGRKKLRLRALHEGGGLFEFRLRGGAYVRRVEKTAEAAQ